MKTLSTLKKGDIFTFPFKKKVYVFSGKTAKTKKTVTRYHYHAYDDINDIKSSTQGGKEVDVDITF